MAFQWPALGAETIGLIAPGTPWETRWVRQDSGVSGPTVVIVSGVHGDEPAGPLAAGQICRWPIIRGRLIVVPRANPPALAIQDRLIPGVDTNLANLNRNFPKKGAAPRARGEAAQELWQFVEQQKPDWLLDLHEGTDFHLVNSNSVGGTIIFFPTVVASNAALAMLAAVNVPLTNHIRHFLPLWLPIDGSLARAAAEHLAAQTMILETPIKNQRLTTRARQHRVMVHVLLKRLDMIDTAVLPDLLAAGVPSADRIRVALYDGQGASGKGVPTVLAHLGFSPHPEQTAGVEQFVARAVTWVARR